MCAVGTSIRTVSRDDLNSKYRNNYPINPNSEIKKVGRRFILVSLKISLWKISLVSPAPSRKNMYELVLEYHYRKNLRCLRKKSLKYQSIYSVPMKELQLYRFFFEITNVLIIQYKIRTKTTSDCIKKIN